MRKFIFTTLVAAAFLTSCGSEEAKENDEATESHAETSEVTSAPAGEMSTKGNWSATDKEKANAAVAAIDSQLAAFGDKKQDFIDCYLQKVEDNYNSFDEANVDLEGCSSLAESCANEVMAM